jgi:hypothetical protein
MQPTLNMPQHLAFSMNIYYQYNKSGRVHTLTRDLSIFLTYDTWISERSYIGIQEIQTYTNNIEGARDTSVKCTSIGQPYSYVSR